MEDLDSHQMPDTSNPSWNGEPEADHQLGDLLEHDLDITWEQEIARRKKAWKSKEVEFRTHASVDRSNLHQDSNSSHYPEQIFTEALTCDILINELVSIMKSTRVRTKNLLRVKSI